MIQLIAGFAIAALLTVLLGDAMSLSLSDDDRIVLFVVLLLVQFALFALVMAIVDLVNLAKHQKKDEPWPFVWKLLLGKLQAHRWPLAVGGLAVVGLVGYLVVEMPGAILDANTPVANTTARTDVKEPPAKAPAAVQISTAAPFVRIWAKAWETGQTDLYLTTYSPGFTPEDAMPRNQWEKLRRQRVDTAKQIVIEILDLTVTPLNGNRAVAVFTQHYTSKSYKDISRKTLTMENVNGQWLILTERAEPLPL